MMNIIFFATVYPLLFLCYFLAKVQYKKKENNIFGVDIKSGWEHDETVEFIIKTCRKETKRIFVLLGVMPFASLFFKHMSIQFTVWMVWMLANILLMPAPFVKANIRLKKWKAERGGYGKEQVCKTKDDAADDRNWIGGIFYYNPQDKRTSVRKRMGVGTTVNLAKPAGKAVAVFSGLAFLLIPFSCVWLLLEEFTPIALKIDEKTLYAEHINVDYEIHAGDMEQLEIITELPRWSKSVGTAMDTLEKGTFSIRNEGRCEVFLNPENKKFIRFSADGVTYYMSGSDDFQTEEIYNSLMRIVQEDR